MYSNSKSEVEQLEEEVYNTLLELIDLAKLFVKDVMFHFERKIDFGKITVWFDTLDVETDNGQRLLVWEPLKEKRVIVHYEGGVSEFNFDTCCEPYLRASVRIFVKYHPDMAYYTLRLPDVMKQIMETNDTGK